MGDVDRRKGGATTGSPAVRLHWYVEVSLVIGFYLVYSMVRNQFGSASVHPAQAFSNALHVIHFERAMDLFVEVRIQETFLGWRPFMQLWNVFYGTFHFVVTAAVMILLFRRAPLRYRRWRTILGLHDRRGAGGLQPLPADAAPPARRLRAVRRAQPAVPVHRHPGRLRRAVVVQLGWDEVDLEPVRGDAEPARGVGGVVRAGDLAAAAAPLEPLGCSSPTPSSRSSPWWSPANHYWLDGVGGLIALGLGFALTICFAGVIGRLRVRWERHRAGEARALEPSAERADEPVPTG